MNNLDSRIEQELRGALETAALRGDILPPERLQEYYAVFRERFGPDKLKALDGQPLLQTMHGLGTKDGLVYWLEFKNDEEFPGRTFGSIAGGSAHKYGLFRRKETGQWVKGSPQNEQAISEAEAIEVARRHRDELMTSVAVLDELPVNSNDELYRQLQAQLDKVAPDISGLGWAHKYLSLLFLGKLDDYHNHRWQRFNLIKLLQLPPQQEGLYVAAGRFVSLAVQFSWPMNHLTWALNERNGSRPAGYWRIGTRLGGEESIWPAMRDGGYIAIGWDQLGDLSALVDEDNSKEAIRERLAAHYHEDQRTLSRKAGEIRNFLARIAEADVAVAADGQKVLGLGKVIGPYRYERTNPTGAPHRRPVKWISTIAWDLPNPEGLRTTVFPIKQHETNLIEIERRLLDGAPPKQGPTSITLVGQQSLEGIPGRVEAILDRKGQAILYGPPGTGKTYWARRTALDLAALKAFGRRFDDLSPNEKTQVEGTAVAPGLVRSCTFHPAYGYEDFIEGFRPHSNQAGRLIFELRDGIFKQICVDARGNEDRKFFLLVDEINRGDIPRIFGELLTLLELDKRAVNSTLAVSQEAFSVPRNLHLIGTMNTADRSIALLDTALRRRFGFVELMPDTGLLSGASVEGDIPLGPWLTALNDRIRAHLGRDARNLQIGHAYFLENGRPVGNFAKFIRILSEDIIPLLEEYCYEDYDTLAKILGQDLVDQTKQRVKDELFTLSRRQELVQALLSPAPELVTSVESTPLEPALDDSDEAEPEENEK